MRLPTRRQEISRRLKSAADNFLTPAKIESLKKQLADLIAGQRPLAIKEVQRTQEMGDLSENAAYQEAKHRLRRINGKITIIEEQLKTAIPIRPAGTNQVSLGSTVMISDGQNTFSYQIVGAAETDPARGRISHASPLGAALLGKKIRDSITLPSGANFTIKRIN